MDFFEIKTETRKNDNIIFPVFNYDKCRDIMIRGKAFYAIWDEEQQIWSTDEFKVRQIVDDAIDKCMAKNPDILYKPLYMKKSNSNKWKEYRTYIKDMPDNFHQLDTTLAFANSEVKKTDYISRKLPYCLEEGDISAYDELMSVLYAPDERKKLEWAIGSIITGDSKKIQKFIAITGEPGKGKGTFLNILYMLFEGYTSTFNAKELANGNNAFAGDAFASNPLVAIQTDGNLSKIQDNTLLNSIISHEKIIINEKFKAKYEIKLNSFLFMATNDKIEITNFNSGMKRRLIDVNPTNNIVESDRYDELMEEIELEKGAIAFHCLEVYKAMGKHFYDKYEAKKEIERSNPVYNFVETEFLLDKDLEKVNYISLANAYKRYKDYCEDSGFKYHLSRMDFRDELKHYFYEFKVQCTTPDGNRERSVYFGLKRELFEDNFVGQNKPDIDKIPKWLELKEQPSKLDELMKDFPAQYTYTTDKGLIIPKDPWADVKTTLKDIDTSKYHYINCPQEYIVIDLDLKDESGNKNAKLNIEAAKMFPPTYAEFSQGGEGLHLHYIYQGDPTQLERKFNDNKNIEIKVYSGDGAVRRRLTKCNNLNISFLEPGFLPLKERRKKVLKEGVVKNEQVLRIMIQKNLDRTYHDDTTSSIHFIKKLLDDAVDDGIKFDVTDLRPTVMAFAANATNQSEHCLEVVGDMVFKNLDEDDLSIFEEPSEEAPIIFYDVEVFPNLFILNYKFPDTEDKKYSVVRMINPTPEEIKTLMKYRLVGFYNRKYDNHIIYARMQGYSNQELFNLSSRLVGKSSNGEFAQAYNLSYTDIYDYASKKQSLKKWEIELGIHHQELGLPWDKPVPKNLWDKVAEYCDNDVIATEAVWNATQGDFAARKILAEIADGLPCETTNKLSQKFIFGDNKYPQDEFNYRFMGEAEPGQECTTWDDGLTCFQQNGKPVFLGYVYDKFKNKSSYLDVDDVGEGGYVFARPGMYSNVWTFDVTSMHPSSVIAEELFGPRYTKRFADILQLRIYIKHKEFDKAKKMFDGKLAKYLEDPKLAKALAQALKIVINSVYGLTAAGFENPFRDERNIDNIVAKRGALFMINLRTLVERMGYTVVHVKTDSIKVANPDKKIYKFIMDYGKAFGYNFEIEHKFEKICLVNNAVYIAKLSEDDEEWIEDCKAAEEKGKPIPTRWTATGTQFAVPYVFKTLFSGEEVGFDDFCETKSVTKGDLYLDRNEDMKDVSVYEKALETLTKIKQDKKVTKKAQAELEELGNVTEEDLKKKIAKGHNYIFVGRVGSFVPINPGDGGGTLYRYDAEKDKYFAAPGTDGYRWLEAEYVKDLNIENCVDKSYHRHLVDDAIDAISQYGDFEWFAS